MRRLAIYTALVLLECSKPNAVPVPQGRDAGIVAPAALADPGDPPLPPSATACPTQGKVRCTKFTAANEAFRWVLAFDPTVLAIGEAHAQRGTESITSSTKHFTDDFLPLLQGRASDVVVELWAPDPTCQREVKAVASAQKQVTSAQAPTTQNEYVALAVRAREKGIVPWLLRPTCDDFAMLVDAGADDVGASLGLVRRLTQSMIEKRLETSGAERDGGTKLVVAYGGAMHNDIEPDPEMKAYAFGPDMVKAHGKGYIELDLIVPEYVKDTPTWKKLPWYGAWQVETGPKNQATLLRTGARSFVLLFPAALSP
jgi:hypothetical protein